MKINLRISVIFWFVIATSSINVPLCSNGGVNIQFKDTQGVTDPTTRANICHDRQNMYVTWQNIDAQIISTYTNCNDPLYKEDVVQIFLASIKTYPLNYWEIQVSPKGTLFFSDITNPSGNCSKFSGNLQNCNLISGSAKILSKGWEAHLTVSLSIVERSQGGNQFYANIFRIDYTTNKTTRYLAFHPTGTPTPCFHLPSKFEKFVLLNMTQSHISSQ